MKLPEGFKNWVFYLLVGTIAMGSAGGIAIGAIAAVSSEHSTSEIVVLQKEHAGDLKTIKHLTKTVATEGGRIEGYARSLERQISDNHGSSYTILVALCQETPGCVVPTD